MSNINRNADVYSVPEFKDMAERGELIDYDGQGYALYEGHYDIGIAIKPSDIEAIPEDVKNVIWFNKT